MHPDSRTMKKLGLYSWISHGGIDAQSGPPVRQLAGSVPVSNCAKAGTPTKSNTTMVAKVVSNFTKKFIPRWDACPKRSSNASADKHSTENEWLIRDVLTRSATDLSVIQC